MTDEPIAASTPAPADTAPVWREASHALLFPIPAEGEAKIASITIREPDSEALERIEGLGMTEGKAPTLKQTRGLIEALAGLPDGSLKKLHHKDLTALSEISGPFLEGAMGG